MVRKRKINFLALFVLIFAFVLTGTILSFGNQNGLNAYAYTSGNTPTSIGSLTVSGYENRSDGLVFDKDILDTLYGKLTGKTKDTYSNAWSKVQASTSTLTGSTSSAYNSINTQNHSMNFSQINNGNAITVKFGGFTWNVVYATTNTYAGTNGGKAGDLIVTLWMSEVDTDSSVSNVVFNDYATNNSQLSYPSGMYSTSKMRVSVLNGGGDNDTTYAISNTQLSTVTNATKKNHHYSALTMSNDPTTGVGKKSLTAFLATPSQVEYQKQENWVWSFYNLDSDSKLMLNEAWGTDGNGPPFSLWYTNDNNTTNDNHLHVISKPRYTDWAKQDYLWLPSLTETGYHRMTNEYGVSLWGIPNGATVDTSVHSILNSSQDIWLRSGASTAGLTDAQILYTNGARDPIDVNIEHAIRPALHLNLTKAQENISVNDPGTAQSREYNGSIQKLDSAKETWFTADYQNKVDIKYYLNGTNTTVDPQAVGTYQVGFTPKSGRTWSNGDTNEKKIDFVISKGKLDFPSIANNSQPYTGGGNIIFSIANATNSAIKISVPSEFTNIINYNDAIKRAIVTEVDDYYLLVDIANDQKANYEFKDPSKNRLDFSVTPATVDVDIYGSGNSHALQGPQGGTVNATLNVNINESANHIHENNSISVCIYARSTGYPDIPISDPITLTNDSHAVPVTLDLSFLSDGTIYELVVMTSDSSSLKNANYDPNLITKATLEVLSSAYRPGLTWILNSASQGGISTPTGQRKEATINDTSVTFTDVITYDGKHYTFTVNPPTGYTVESYSISPANLNSSDPNVGIYVDTYTTTVTLRNSEGTKQFSILWTISKAKFDLSNVRWLGNGQVPFAQGGVSMTLDPTTLPDGLNPTYGGITSGTSVGPAGQISVSFADLQGVYNNYIKPVQSDPTSYIFTDGTLSDFEWNKNWEIVQAVIPVAWKNGSFTDKNGVPFNAPVLEDDAYAGFVEYHFFETDKNGNVLDENNYLTLSQMEITENVQKYFKVQAVVASNFANNYRMANDSKSTLFTFGEASEAVTVDLNDKQFTYNGKAQSVSVKIITGAISANQFDIVYYDRNGVSPLSGAPVNVGEYRVEISIKAGVSGFHLTGDNVSGGVATINYEIVKKTIDNSTWVTSHNPPSLQLSFADTQQVQYEYADMDGNTLAFNQLAPGNTYKVRARIKDMNNCEFATADASGDVFNTDWVEFTVSENEQLYDPLDPNNPFYPEDPDNPNNPDNPDNPDNPGNGIGDKIKEFFDNLIKNNFPLWQIATIAAGGLLTLIFMIKATQYGNRKKKAKGEAKKISAKTYAAFLPVFDTTLVLAGLSNKVWSIIAFAMVGVTVLMFLIAILTRRGWKKAELAKEQAIEDSEQRRIDAEKQEREAEKRERREREEAQEARQLEFQERITQAAQSGAQISDSSAFEQRLLEIEERHRQEMDAMKMMFANMMGRANDGDMPYASMDDTDLLVQKVIAGLLPAVQQMMPEPTAYLAAPNPETDELKALVAEQTETMRNMADEMQQQNAQIAELQSKLDNMSHDVLDAEIIPDNSEEIRALKEEHDARIDEQNAQIEEQNAQIADLQNQIANILQDRVEGELLPDQTEEIKALNAKIEELQQQIADGNSFVAAADNSEELRAMAEAHQKEMSAVTAEMLAMRSQLEALSSMSVDELDDEDFDDEEEWDSILDEDDDDFVEAVIIDDNGKERKVYPNFRMRLKQSSDKNREWYAVIKNLFCSQKGVTYRVYKRVEKIRYQGQVIAVIGIAKRSIKLWLALKPYEYDARRYHHKDVSDKPRFVDVPMYVRITSDRALDRSQELILALFQELNMEARKRYTDRPIQELIFTLKHNRLLTNKQNKQLLCEVMHVHDCDVLDDETAEKCIEAKNVESLDESNIETVKLDDIDAKFQDGNRVTLDRLKKVGLVSEDCTGYTVTADKRLTKPLIIVANDFTLTAVKLIVLTGGRAIKLQTV